MKAVSRNKGAIVMVNGRTTTDKLVVMQHGGDNNEEVKSSCNATGTSYRETSMTLKHPDFFETKPLPNQPDTLLQVAHDNFFLHGQ
jgi:hypothetical protein